MEILEFDKYLTKSKNDAYADFIDKKNFSILNGFLYFFGFIFFVKTIDKYFSPSLDFFDLPILTISFIAIFFLIFRYKKYVSLGNIRKFISIVLIGSLSILIIIEIIDIKTDNKIVENNSKEFMSIETDGVQGKIVLHATPGNATDVGILMAISLLIFRLDRRQIIEFFCFAFFAPMLMYLFFMNDLSLQNDIPWLVIIVLISAIALYIEKRRRLKFFGQYDFYYKRGFENLRMKKELDYARQMQLSMLPESNTIIYDIEIAGISNPASEVGGDYFDYFHISQDKIGVFICDVSGHGVASGLMLAGLRSSIHLILEDTSEPVAVMKKLNRMVRKTQNKKMFVTAIFAVIDLKENKCNLFNAGHLPPYKVSGDTGEIFKIKNHGITLGATDKIDHNQLSQEVTFEFLKNDKLIFYTDGVTEAMDNKKEEYGFEKIEKLISAHSDKRPAELVDLLCKDITSFIGGISQRDDLTILITGRI
ncbi:MAG: PP2C family protein-serine/threonine phosphatase [Ignavibacteriaceae bacterium]|nr:PP2C family protein-serine/threonine phosphatase [Ignavibacteriaceae bacterium]